MAPTVFDDVAPSSALAQNEIFGPVLSVIGFDGLDEAVEIANGTVYGLGASVWSADLAAAHKVARRFKAGIVYVNCFDADDITTPFGGVKQSGFGRDKSLHARWRSIPTSRRCGRGSESWSGPAPGQATPEVERRSGGQRKSPPPALQNPAVAGIVRCA